MSALQAYAFTRHVAAAMRPLLLPATFAALLAGSLSVAQSDADLVVSGVTVAAVNGAYAVQLVRLAVWRRGAARSRWTSSVGVVLLGGGLLAAALTGAAIALTPTLDPVHWGLGGLVAAALCYLPGMLLMPGASESWTARLRHGFDGLSVGICLLFTAWVLVIAPNGSVRDPGLWIAILTACTICVALVSGARSVGGRGAAFARAGGVALSMFALAGLALVVADHFAASIAVIAGALVVAPVLIWRGVRDGTADEAGPAGGLAPFAAHPVLVVPVATAMVVALHRLISGAPFDRPSIMLGVAGVAAVAVRETLATRDVSHFARRVAQQEAQFRNLVAGSTDVIMVLDGDLIVRWQSPAAARQLGLTDHDVVGRHFLSMVHPEDAVPAADRLADALAGYGTGAAGDRPALVAARLRDGFGQWRDTESSVSDQRDVPSVDGLVIHIRDVSERKEMERALHRLAYADQLTGLANRRQMLMSIVALRSLPRARGALLLLELDGFNAVNDVRGYDIGDAVLVEVARRLRAGVAETDLPARLSGDEFAVVTEATPVQAYALATRLLTILAEPILLPQVTVHLTASIGMTDLAGGASCDDVLRSADLALRRAKQLGRGRVEWFDEAVEQALLRRMTLEMELPDALVRGELDLIYQPILDLATPRPCGVEALLRWRHPRLGTILPAEVIPVAEDLGLIAEIGNWVLYQAGRQLAQWRRDGRDLSMAVNVSPRQLGGAELAADVAAVLEMHDLPAERLVLEVAEAGLTDLAEADERIRQVRSLGVRTALDEFGTGPDSLTHLRRLPVDLIKIGRPFFDETAEVTARTGPIIDVMVGLGRRLGIDVVAHGLEQPAHLETVRAAGCHLGQGHLFARPQPVERTEAYLDGLRARSH